MQKIIYQMATILNSDDLRYVQKVQQAMHTRHPFWEVIFDLEFWLQNYKNGCGKLKYSIFHKILSETLFSH